LKLKESTATVDASIGKVKWVLFNPKTYITIVYFLISLPLGIIYFTGMVAGLVLSIVLTPIFIGIPLFFGVAKFLNGMITFEQTMIRQILGIPFAPILSNDRQEPEAGQNWFMRMVRNFDGGLFIRDMLLIVLRLITGIVFFAVMIAALSVSLGLITLPVVHIILMNEMQLDILENNLFRYFHIDWTYSQQYLLYVGIGIILFWVALRIVNGLMQMQRRMMYVDEHYQKNHAYVQEKDGAKELYQSQYDTYAVEQPIQSLVLPSYRDI